MSMHDVHYVFRDSQVFAIREGKVIAHGPDSDVVEAQVKQAFGPDSLGEGVCAPVHEMHDQGHAPMCEHCGSAHIDETGRCQDCGQQQMHGGGPTEMPPLPEDLHEPADPLGGQHHMMASVITPNGLKGTVLGKTAGVWGDEVTIRLENGRIVKLPTNVELRSPKQASTKKKVSPLELLETRLSKSIDGTRESMVSRIEDLKGIRRSASRLVGDGCSYADSVRLDQIVVAAEVESRHLTDAIAHIDDADSMRAPGFSMQAADRTSSVSREDASWLDVVMDDMIKEAEAQDFNKLLAEGPEALTAELPDVALADTGVTRQMASSFIMERTAGIAREVANPYMDTFLARVEECRKAELASRKQTTHKEAATVEKSYDDVPDDALFL